MKLSDLFTKLSYGELSNLSIGCDGAGTIELAQQPKVVNYVNDGLTRLYSKYVLKEADVIIQLQNFITEYYLLDRYASNNPSPDPEDTLYILDYPSSPFEEDVIKIIRATDAEGNILSLNDPENKESFFTPQYNVLQVPFPIQDVIIGVVYQARHPIMTHTNLDATIDLPVSLYEALQSFVAHKIFFHMGGDNLNIAAGHLANFDRICDEVKMADTANTSSSQTSSKFNKRGFV